MKVGRVEISVGFVIFICAAWFLDTEELLLTMLAGSVVHELGHVAAIKLFGASVSSLKLSAVGAELDIGDRERLSYPKEIAVCLAGPLASVLAAFIASAAAQYAPGREQQALNMFSGVSLVLGAFNMLPVRSLDGGGVVRYLSMFFAGRVVLPVYILHYAAVALIFGAGLFVFFTGSYNITLILLATWFILSDRDGRSRE